MTDRFTLKQCSGELSLSEELDAKRAEEIRDKEIHYNAGDYIPRKIVKHSHTEDTIEHLAEDVDTLNNSSSINGII